MLVFRASELEEKPIKDLYSFLREEKLVIDDPRDFYEETEFAGITNVVSIKVPKYVDEKIRWIFNIIRNDEKLVGFSVRLSEVTTGRLLRKMHKHGLMLLSDMEGVQRIHLVDEALKLFALKVLNPTSIHYSKEYAQVYHSVVGQLDQVSDRIQSIFPYSVSEYRSVSFRALPRWKSKARVLSGVLRISEYNVNRLALMLSISTVVDIGMSVREVEWFFSRLADEYYEIVRPLDEIYVREFGQKLLGV